MTIKALFAAAAVGSMFAAGAAFAEDYNKSPNTAVNQTPAQSSADVTARSNYEATVQAQGDQLDAPIQTAETPSSANVAATVDQSTSPTVTTEVIASAPVPDTPANRARYGQPLSRAGKMTAPRGN
jgi:hypothetical protein